MTDRNPADPPPTPLSSPPPTPPLHDRRMLEALICPVTQGPLTYDAAAQELLSPAANLAFPIRDGIPIMLTSEARTIA